MIYLFAFVYVIALISANLIVAKFGPIVIPFTSFALIGLDLVMRDVLHDKISKRSMFVLILVTGLITYLVNSTAGKIAIASSIAFTLASFVDWSVFSRVNGSWRIKSNASNVSGAIVDSIVFPLIAFGNIAFPIMLSQIVAKTTGSFVWSWFFGVTRNAGKAD